MLTFDEENHVYRWNDAVVPSVTQILKHGGIIDDRWYTDDARDRGVAVHKAADLHIRNNLDEGSIHPIVRPYFDGLLKFMKDTRFKPMLQFCEVRQFHPIYIYAGTPDFFGILNGRPALIDVKTGDARQSARYQTAAYANFPMLKAYSPDRFDLRLYNDGRYKLNPHPDAQDFNVFLSCLNVARAKGAF